MRLLHTSDWHLGRGFLRQDLSAAQATFLDHLVETVRTERVDAVVVSGDVFDRAIAPVDSVSMFGEVLRRFSERRVRVVLISGNHDSPQRLGLHSGLLRIAGVHVLSDPSQVGSPVVIEDAHGPVEFHGIPYLEPDAIREPWSLPERSHAACTREAMARVRSGLRARRQQRAVVLSHAWVTGGLACDSERDISVGGLSNVPLAAFEGASYVALGHLHGRQTLAPNARYCGSPLAYSFSEADQVKGSWLVDLDRAGNPTAQFVEAPVPRRLARISGGIDDLLTDQRFTAAQSAWVKATVTDPQRPRGLGERLTARFPHLLQAQWEPASTQGQRPARLAERLVGRSPQEITLDFIASTRGRPADEDEADLLLRGIECCRQHEVAL